MKNKIFVTALIFSMFLASCKKEKVGGNCEYISLEKEMTATFVDGDLHGEFTISLQPKNSNGDEVYRVNNVELKKISRNFDLKEFLNKNNKFTMFISEISKGSCVPFKITKLTLD